MVEKTAKKRMIIHEIYTTTELEETVYFTIKAEIVGAFVQFNPFQIKTRFQTSGNEKDTVFILPERVIKKILKVDVTEEMLEQMRKIQKP
jgi:hypothetical protein